MTAPDRSVALVTPSYAGDLERARLLCETVDHHVAGVSHHYILVDPLDVPLFRDLNGPRRTVIDERDILPRRLRIVNLRGRRLWLGWAGGPRALRGWHVQQLRRIAIAQHVREAALLYCDSDMTFTRSFDVASLWEGESLRLYRVPGGIHADLVNGGREHFDWTRWAARLNGLPKPDFPAADHINNLVSWRADRVREMCASFEDRFATDWMSAVTRRRRFSECQIYGAYAAEVRAMLGHYAAAQPLCRTYWFGDALAAEDLRRLVEDMDEGQVAIGVQSFTNTSVDLIRRAVLA